ncbi:S8 family serine peptidase [Chryseobacterium sp. Tr-659]|uniref:S8 family serine peptidase n=1 Tax=Chryseobacterium sp. Tr-659 TaxID=2608340 RepID=UPI001423105B|nr:S8 family serine peptidase [Chryseobacterium sp. Tr-659]NIF05558.1 S8 family serine peptidase [Chryseobacterium sp. Tr-659]
MKKRILFSTLLTMSASVCFFAQTEADRQEITKKYDKKELHSLFDQFSQTAEAEAGKVAAYAREHKIPVIIKGEDGSIQQLMRIDEDGTPIYYTNTNVDAAKSTRTNHLNTGGSLNLDLNGENMVVSVWDGGSIRKTHQEFGTRVTVKDGGVPNDHATHVGGTVGASGVIARAKGMAWKSSINSYDWNNDEAEMTSAAATGLLLSNHSYGLVGEYLQLWQFGAYINESRDWDNILFNAPSYLAVKAAGNDGRNRNRFTGVVLNTSPMGGSTDFYDKLTGAATSKNALVVANAQDANIGADGNLISVAIHESSSQGPTDDLRIKPDIAGNGTGVYSPVAYIPGTDTKDNPNTPVNEYDPGTPSNNSYNAYTGTSMASPNVMGSLTLVQQHNHKKEERYMLGAELKGLALHTADDAGAAGPDAMFGWGLLNAKKMVETINAKGKTSIIENRTLNNLATDTLTVKSDGVTPLIVSISWYDRGGALQTSSQLNDNATKRLVNNLDLKVIKVDDNTEYLPWVLTSRSTNAKAVNNNDNFERVDLGVVPKGDYKIEITHKGTLAGNLQNYTLIVTGKEDSGNVSGPAAPSCINAYESNETISTAAAININQDITAAISSATDRDFYKFTIGAGKLTAKLNGPVGVDYDLYIYNASGALLGKSEDTSANEAIALNNRAAGTYYARVIGYNGANSTTCYSLNISATAPITAGTSAGAINTNAAIYPNPADKEITVRDAKEGDNYIIYDYSGKVMKQGSVIRGKVDLHTVHPGNYILKVNNKAYKFIKK